MPNGSKCFIFISNSVSNSFFDKFAMVKWHYWYTQFGLFVFFNFHTTFHDFAAIWYGWQHNKHGIVIKQFDVKQQWCD